VCGKNATFWAMLRGVIRSIQGVRAVEITGPSLAGSGEYRFHRR
jgi:hypothetical protein